MDTSAALPTTLIEEVSVEEPMSTHSMTSSTSTCSVGTSKSLSKNPLECIIWEATQFATEIKKLKGQLVLAEQRIAQERKGRLEAEEKYVKLKNSVKSVNDEYSLLFEDVKKHLIDEGQESFSSSCELEQRLDQLSKVVAERLGKHVDEQMKLKAMVKRMDRIIQNLTEVVDSQNSSTSTTTQQANSRPSVADEQRAVPTERPAPPPPSDESNDSIKIIGECSEKSADPPKLPNPGRKSFLAKSSDAHAPMTITSQESVGVTVVHAVDTSKNHPNRFYCICGAVYGSKSGLTVHIQTFTKDGKFECHICHEKCVLFCMLRRHLQSKHNIKLKNASGHQGCRECGKTFPSHSHVIKHRYSEHSSKRDPSYLENQRQSASFAKKEKISNKVSPKSVSIVGKKKHGMNLAKRHLGIHCICGTTFISRAGLDGHLRHQNKQSRKSSPPAKDKKIFGCVICDGAFSRVADLYRHLTIIHSADPFKFPIQCPDCGEICRSGQKLMGHRRTAHLTSQRKQEMKPEAERRSKLAVSCGSNVSIPIIDLDDDEEGGDASSQLLLEPTPNPIDIGEEEDQEMLAMPKLKLKPAGNNQANVDAGSSNHRQVSSRESDKYLCSCGSNYAVKASLLKHIAEKTRAD